jgi:hypothetical protein
MRHRLNGLSDPTNSGSFPALGGFSLGLRPSRPANGLQVAKATFRVFVALSPDRILPPEGRIIATAEAVLRRL